jgi:hypothetical protein
MSTIQIKLYGMIFVIKGRLKGFSRLKTEGKPNRLQSKKLQSAFKSPSTKDHDYEQNSHCKN